MAVFDKAKQLRDQAAEKAAALKEQATTTATTMKDSALTKATEMRDTVSAKADDVKGTVITKASEMKDSVAQAASDAKEASVARLKEAIDDFNSTLPVLRRAGYRVSEVDIALGLPPTISASVEATSDVTEEHVEQVLAENHERKLTTLIVRSLFQAWKLQNATQIVGMKPRGMTIELGLVPSVTIKFVSG